MRITGFMGGGKAKAEKVVLTLENDSLIDCCDVFGWGCESIYDGDSYVRKQIANIRKCKRLVIMLKMSSGETKYKEVSLDELKPLSDGKHKSFTIEGIDGTFSLYCELSSDERPYVGVWIYYRGTSYESRNDENGEYQPYLISGTWSEDGTHIDGSFAYLI